ncbi:MAG: hypothetical protein ACXV5N_13600 [Halobacteriota archaeon]
MIKKLAIAVLIVMMTSLSIAGCTSTTSTNNSASSAGQASVVPSQSNLSSHFNQIFGPPAYLVETPFTKTVNYRGNDVYTGVARRTDRSQGAGFTAVIELVNTQSEAKKLFNDGVAKAQSEGYTYRSDWIAGLNKDEGKAYSNEQWAGSYYTMQKYFFYRYDTAASSWIVITETA